MENYGLDQKLSKLAFLSFANINAHQLPDGIRWLCLLDAVIPGENLDAPFLQLGKQTLDNKNEVTLGEAHRHSVNDGGKDAQAYGVGNRLLAALLLLLGILLGIDALISGWPLLLRAVDGAFGVSADFPNLTFFCTLGDNGLGHRFASLILRPIPLLLRVRVLRLDLDVLIAGQGRAAAIGGGCGRSKGR